MLIVIVIIGILIAALMPRMQAAQWRARDVSRKTALSQVQSAIVTSQWDKWYWPWQCENVDGADQSSCAENWTGISSIETPLKTAWMNSVPVDPLKTTDIVWLWDFAGNEKGDYSYMVTTRNWTPNWWFVLMAKTEVEWWSNWIVCTDANGAISTKTLAKWFINKEEDITLIHPCTSFVKDENETIGGEHCKIENETCYYEADGQLRYIVLY
jgi:type II secretory pathway pseudopilin PulG